MRAKMVVVAIVLVFLAPAVMAQEAEKVSTMIDIRMDGIFPEKGENQTAQSVNILWQGKRFGGFFEGDYKSNGHVFTAKPSLLLINGPWYLLGGVATNSLGSDFAQAGVWYVNRLGQFSVLLDVRNYWSISGKGNSYTDNLLRVVRPIGGKFSAGLDLAYDHWWNEPSRNWYFVGPRLSYQLSKSVSVYLRVSREWDIRGSRIEATDRVRTGLSLFF